MAWVEGNKFMGEIIALVLRHEFTLLPHHSGNIGGFRGRAWCTRPLRVQILLFRHTKFLKRNRLGSRPPTRSILDPPLGNVIE